MKKNFKLINKKILHKGFYQLYEYVFKHKKYDGSWSINLSREIFGGANVVNVLPYDPIEKKIVLIEQFRAGLIEKKTSPFIKEIVAGVIDNNEKPEQAARRECKEETGCKIKKLKKIFSYYPVPGSSQSHYHLFLAEIDSFTGDRILGMKNEGEDILSKCYTLKEVKKMLDRGNIINGLTIVALQWFFLNYKIK